MFLLFQYWGLNISSHACLSKWSTIKLFSKTLENYIRGQGSFKDEPQNPSDRQELMKISSPHFFKKIVLVYVACMRGHVYIHAATPVCGGQMSTRSLLFSTLSFNFLSSTEFKAHESAKLPGYWAPRIFKSSLPSTGIIGMCHRAHFSKLKCLRLEERLFTRKLQALCSWDTS